MGVTVDGDLAEWDLSGQIEMFVVSETRQTQSARLAVMYDGQALYLGATVRDPSPMMNRHAPEVDAHKAWDADACQFRLVVDRDAEYPLLETSFEYSQDRSREDRRDDIVHLTLWHYTDRGEAALQMHRGMTYRVPRPEWSPHGAVPPDLFDGAYCRAGDGGGYSFEYRIPWSTLGAANPPRGGDAVAGAVQFNWSAPDGLTTAGGSAWAYDVMRQPGFPYQSAACWGRIVFAAQGGLPAGLADEGVAPPAPLPLRFAYDLPEDGQVTIALLDSARRYVRILAAQAPRLAGQVVEEWDGLDDGGRPLPPGTYTWKGLYHQPITTRFVLSVHNSGRPPYKLDDGTGGWGADHGTATAVCSAGDAVFLAWNASESGWGLIRTDLDGRKQWGTHQDADHLATDGTRVFAAGGMGFDRSPGVRALDADSGRPLNWGNGSPRLELPGAGAAEPVTGLACGGGRVYAAWGGLDAVGVFDGQSGALLATWTVPGAGALAVRPDGSLAAVSRGRVVAVAEGRTAPLVDHHLAAPRGLAIGPDGTLYVANGGKRQDVSVFAPDGRYRRSIGKEGDRPRRGRYDSRGMLEPGGIALDREGRLWVAETLDAPKRQSVWDAATGELVAEYFGGSAYFGWAYMDPEKPDEIYCHNVLWRVDLDRGTWEPLTTVWRATRPNEVGEAEPGGYAGHFRVVTARSGRQFGWGMRGYGNVLFMRDGDLFRPIAAAIHVQRHNPYMAWPPYPIFADSARFADGTYLWQDGNGDQTIQ
ncbi:MAG: hypothetical protein ABIL09_25920, partial [Gemmatimonadota bacterium]